MLALLMASARTTAGQTTFGMITGRVTDSTGAVLPGVTVTVVNTRTAATRVAVTNDQGLYRAASLNPSQYDVRVELAGFRPVIQRGVDLAVSETLTLAFKLDVESVQEAVVVTGSSPLVNTSNAEVGSKIDARHVLDLPVNSRDFSRLALFTPAAKVTSSGVAAGD
jgi:hypothetical protein